MTVHWNALWRRGAGTQADPDNGRLVWRILGVHPCRWPRRSHSRRWYAPDLRPLPIYWLRTFWNEVSRYGYETCNRCGRQIDRAIGDTYWHAENGLYTTVVGHDGGTFCARCFTKAARRRGIRLWWEPKRMEKDGGTTEPAERATPKPVVPPSNPSNRSA